MKELMKVPWLEYEKPFIKVCGIVHNDLQATALV